MDDSHAQLTPTPSFQELATGYAATFPGGFVDSGNVISGPSLAWEHANNADPFVTKYNGVFYLFYSSIPDVGVQTTPEASYPLGPWTKSATAILLHGQQPGVDDSFVFAPVVFQLPSGTWRMYYSAHNGTLLQLCLAEAPAVTGPWTPYAGNPVMRAGAPGTFDYPIASAQCVHPPWNSPDGLWHAYEGGSTDGNDWKLGHWFSTDGIAWQRDLANPFYVGGPAGSFDSYCVFPGSGIFLHNGLYYLPYQGFDWYSWRLGFLTSPDLWHWTPYAGNPIQIETFTGGWGPGTCEMVNAYHDPANGILDLWTANAQIISEGAPSGQSDSGYRIGVSRSTGLVTDKLDPRKWRCTGWYGHKAIKPPYPRLWNGAIHVANGAVNGNVVVCSTELFVDVMLSAKFSTAGMVNGSSIGVGLGTDVAHYVRAQILSLNGTTTVCGEYALGAGISDTSGIVVTWTSGYLGLVRRGGRTAFLAKALSTDAWSCIGSVTDGLGDLPMVLTVTQPIAADFSDIQAVRL
jgi:hypothetical protein